MSRQKRRQNTANKTKTWLALGLGALAGFAAWRHLQRSQRAWPPKMPAGGPGMALITGASSGIGETFARRLARDGYDLILVSRRKDVLDALAEELHQRHGIMAQSLAADLANADDVKVVEKRIAATETLSMLINNAGFGLDGSLVELDIQDLLDMVQVHNVAGVCLARAALPGMIARRHGSIINVASLAGLIPSPSNLYGATKAFLVAFSETLHLELRGSGVCVQALCPGFTHTGFHDVMGIDKSSLDSLPWMPAEVVVDESLRALGNGEVVCIPGTVNRLVPALRLLPRFIQYWIVGQAT